MPVIQSVERALKIIELFDEQTKELKITEIGARMGLHKSTVHSLLKTLQIYGYIDQDSETSKYKLGLKLLEKGQLLLQSIDIRTIVRKHLQALSLQTGQTTHLAISDGREGVYLDKVEGEKAAIRYSRIGRRVPYHSSAVGKILIGFMKPHEITEILDGYSFARHTPNTICDRAQFRLELEQVKTNRHAVDNQENEPGVRCAAVPLFDHSGKVSAAISISTMLSHVDDEEFKSFIELLSAEGKIISRELGYNAFG